MDLRAASTSVTEIAWRGGRFSHGQREVPGEAPVSLTYDGSAYAVMMATPSDLADFAVGFSLAEDIVDAPSDIESLEIIEVDGGVEVRMWLKSHISQRLRGKRRSILGPTGCGLCGVDSIAEAIKPVAQVESDVTIGPEELVDAMAQLTALQKLHVTTRAVHAAGLWLEGRTMIVREDVGRHNALDKLAGAAATGNISARNGIVLLTSRVSVELVQKTARLGAPIIAAISAPTSLAIQTAEAARIALIAVMRGDSFEIFTQPQRIISKVHADVVA